jgi:hypothetical protein
MVATKTCMYKKLFVFSNLYFIIFIELFAFPGSKQGNELAGACTIMVIYGLKYELKLNKLISSLLQ